MPVRQPDGLDARAGVGERRCRSPATRSSPSSADVLRRIRWCGPLSRMNATSVPSFLRTRLGWMLPKPIIGRLVVQVFPSIVGDRHDRRRERVGVERQDPPARRASDDRDGPAASSPVAGRAGRASAPGTSTSSSRTSTSPPRSRSRSPCSMAAAKSGLGSDVHDARPRPRGWACGGSTGSAACVLEQGAFPAMVEDRRPEQPDRRHPARRRAPGCSRDSPACRPSGTAGPTPRSLGTSHAPWITTSSDFRSPLPEYQAASRCPSSSSTTHEAWLCLGSAGKIGCEENEGASARAGRRGEQARTARVSRNRCPASRALRS